MARIGALLIKGFGKKRKKTKSQSKALHSARRPVRKNRSKSLSWLRIGGGKTSSKKSIALSLVVPEPLLSAPSLVRALPLKISTPEEQRYLQSGDLVRPDDRLKKSIESFLLDQRSEHTRRAYGKDLKRFVAFLLDRKFRMGMEAIDRSMIIGYKDMLLSEKLEHTTIDRHLATLRSFFRWLVEDGLMAKNPAENVRFLNPKRESRTNGFTDEEVIRILKIPNLHTKTGALHYAILMTLFFCGLRRSELCDLRTSNIGLERGHRFLRLKGKGNAERIVVMLEPVWNAIRHYAKMTPKNLEVDQPLFSPIRNNRTHELSKPLDPSLIFYVVKRYAKLAGLTNRFSPHSCRATAISNARDHNVPDRAIQEFAGWSTTTMITRYDKRKSSLEKSAVHAISYGDTDRELPPVAVANPPDHKAQK